MKKIAIFGSTGSIGSTLLNVIKKDKNTFNVLLLTADKNRTTAFVPRNNYNLNNYIIIHQFND